MKDGFVRKKLKNPAEKPENTYPPTFILKHFSFDRAAVNWGIT
jgi:hypothetical protein